MSAPIALDDPTAELLAGGEWVLVIESTETTVYRITFDDGRPTLYLTVRVGGSPGPCVAVTAEHDRLVWLGDRVQGVAPVPSVVAYNPGGDSTPAVLVTQALAGEADLRMLPDVETAVGLLGRTLAELHRVPPADCPFDAGPDATLDHVTTRVQGGDVDLSELPPGYHRIAPDRLVELLRSMHPGPVPANDRVLLHGDLCVTNLLFDPRTGKATGLVDWRWCGVGDRHRDLAVTARSVLRNFGAEVLPLLFEAYGMPEPDGRRLEFYGVAEELS